MTDCAPQVLAFELEDGDNRPVFTAQVTAATDLSGDKHAIQLEETAPVEVSMCPALAIPESASTQSLLPTIEQVHCVHLAEYGFLSHRHGARITFKSGPITILEVP